MPGRYLGNAQRRWPILAQAHGRRAGHLAATNHVAQLAYGRSAGTRRLKSRSGRVLGQSLQAQRRVTTISGYWVVPSTFTARATISATVISETRDSAIMSSLAHRDSGSVSVGLNAVALVNDRYR